MKPVFGLQLITINGIIIINTRLPKINIRSVTRKHLPTSRWSPWEKETKLLFPHQHLEMPHFFFYFLKKIFVYSHCFPASILYLMYSKPTSDCSLHACSHDCLLHWTTKKTLKNWDEIKTIKVFFLQRFKLLFLCSLRCSNSSQWFHLTRHIANEK